METIRMEVRTDGSR